MTSIASFRHESSSILKLADDLLLEKSFPRGAFQRVRRLVDRLDVIQNGADRYIERRAIVRTGAVPPIDGLAKNLSSTCITTRAALLEGMWHASHLLRTPQKLDEGRRFLGCLITETQGVAKGLLGIAKYAGFITGAAVLALGTYAIWRSTQSESSNRYIVG